MKLSKVISCVLIVLSVIVVIGCATPTGLELAEKRVKQFSYGAEDLPKEECALVYTGQCYFRGMDGNFRIGTFNSLCQVTPGEHEIYIVFKEPDTFNAQHDYKKGAVYKIEPAALSAVLYTLQLWEYSNGEWVFVKNLERTK